MECDMNPSDPRATSGVELTVELQQLIEQLSESVHDEWTRQRRAEGWTYGEHRDDQARTHPCLIPYAELPESEKAIDRGTVEQTIRSLIALGYRVEKSDGSSGMDLSGADPHGSDPGLDLHDIAIALQADAPIGQVLKAWNRLTAQEGRLPVDVYRSVARRLLSNDTPVTAIDVLRRGRDSYADDLLLKQLDGLAWARIGDPQKANQMFADVVNKQNWFPSESLSCETIEEVLGGFARTFKDLGLQAETAADRMQYLSRAQQEYERAYALTHGDWSGINAASVALLLGDTDRACVVAGEVADRCTQQVADGADDYWVFATLGEAALVCGDLKSAERWYRAATDLFGHRFGDANTTRRQARLLLQALGEDATLIDDWIPIPKVVLFAGLPLDAAGESQPRFPAHLESVVRDAIRDWLITHNARVGFSSASSGSPILFQEVLHEIGGECHVILPYEEQFIKDRVGHGDDTSWIARHTAVLERATRVTYASMEKIQPEHITFDYATLVTHGLATIRAQELDTGLLGLTVWDGQPGRTEAATSIVVRCWQHLGLSVAQLDPRSVGNVDGVPISVVPRDAVDEGATVAPPAGIEVMALLFGDAVNFSKLSEDEVPQFVQHFLGAVRDILDRYQDANVVRNTWGDGLYLVFKHVREAGLFSLEVQERVEQTNWFDLGLPRDMSIRLALHAGPVFHCIDPVTGHDNYSGRHVSRAARLEPKTPPGHVFASEAFAALASAQKVTDFTCNYVRQISWAKTYGTFPTYRLQRAQSASDGGPTTETQ